MLRTILCAFLVLQVCHGWNWFNPCKYMEHMNCDGGYKYPDSYYFRDGDRDHHHHHHDDDDYHRHHHGWGSGWIHDRWNGNRRICGNDGVTYKNRCYFVKAHCQHNVEMKHEGPCNAAVTEGPKTTPKPVTSKPNVSDEFCKNLMKQTCHGVNPICGTNGQSYDNECEFEKAKCFDASVHVKHLGTC